MRQNGHEIDAYTWHDYPLGHGYDPKVDSEIMDPTFRRHVEMTGSSIQRDIGRVTM